MISRAYSSFGGMNEPTGPWYTWNIIGCNMGETQTTAGCSRALTGDFLSNIPLWAVAASIVGIVVISAMVTRK